MIKSHSIVKKCYKNVKSQTSEKKSQKVTNQCKKSQTSDKKSEKVTNYCKKDTNL